MELKKLLEERAAVANEMNGLTALVSRENRSFSGEELEKFDKMDADFKAMSEKIETARRVERMSELAPAKDNAGNSITSYKPTKTITRRDQDLAFKTWALRQGGHDSAITREHLTAADKCSLNLNDSRYTVGLGGEAMQRNQSSAINSEGGYLQNDGTFAGLERNLKWFSGARQVAKVIRTDTAEPLSWAYSDDTSNVGYWNGQNVAVTNTNITYAKKTLGCYDAVTAVYPVSLQLLQDARINVMDDVMDVLGQRLGRLTNTAYTVGTANGPTGFMTSAAAGVTAGGATIAYNDLVNLLFSIDKAYRDSPNFAFTMSDSTMSALWKLTDAQNRPLFWNFNMNMADGTGFTLLGKRVVINNDMPSVASGKKPIAVITGDKFVIRDVRDVQIIVQKELYSQQLAVGFVGWLRTDSLLINANTCKTLQMP